MDDLLEVVPFLWPCFRAQCEADSHTSPADGMNECQLVLRSQFEAGLDVRQTGSLRCRLSKCWSNWPASSPWSLSPDKPVSRSPASCLPLSQLGTPWLDLFQHTLQIQFLLRLWLSVEQPQTTAHHFMWVFTCSHLMECTGSSIGCSCYSFDPSSPDLNFHTVAFYISEGNLTRQSQDGIRTMFTFL